jgi:hypothetical protein
VTAVFASAVTDSDPTALVPTTPVTAMFASATTDSDPRALVPTTPVTDTSTLVLPKAAKESSAKVVKPSAILVS